MLEEKPKRRPRTPLSSEELYYFKKLKLLKQQEKTTAFKSSAFYKCFNFINIFFSAILAYYIFSVFFVCCWNKENIKAIQTSKGEFIDAANDRTISDVDIVTESGKEFSVKTNMFFTEPKINEPVYIGTDFLFGKHIKTKFANDNRAFWNTNTYPSFTLSIASLIFVFFIYKVNRHLSHNGLLMAFGLFAFAFLYFILI